jgi:PhnB protein
MSGAKILARGGPFGAHANGVTPHITIRGGRAVDAIAFYEKAFGARELIRTVDEDGHRIVHAQLLINGGSLILHDEFPEYGRAPDPEAVAPSGVVLHLEVDDADVWWERALMAGAEVRLSIADQFWGDRYGQVADPFGYCWSIGSPTTKH